MVGLRLGDPRLNQEEDQRLARIAPDILQITVDLLRRVAGIEAMHAADED
ncbi:hypothetical protein AB0D59_13220 [Streptomyces sp. NPDC048417]